MGRIILLLAGIIVLLAIVGIGFLIGRGDKKRAIAHATQNVDAVIRAARSVAALDPMNGGAVYTHQGLLQFELEKYDDNRRAALTD